MFLPPALRPANLLGPYEAWMFGPGKTYDLPGLLLDDLTSLSAVAEITDGLRPEELPGRFPARQPGRFVEVKVPTLCKLDEFVPRFVPFLIIPDDDGPLRAQDEGRVRNTLSPFIAGRSKEDGSLAHFRLNFPVRAETVDRGFPGPQPPDVPDPTIDPDLSRPLVIMGIIDHGIPFAHGAFRGAAGGTRVDFCWSQTAATNGSGAVLFGREFTRTAIDAMVADHAGDEDAIYRAAGVTSRPGQPPMPLDRMHAHGAHVLDAMAGHWDADTAAQARIIAVDLPASSVWETSGFGKDMFVLAGLHYIMDRARRIADSLGRPDDVPLVINLSYGHSGGPHDGTGLLEAAMDELVAARRKIAHTAMVMPSGNMFQDHLHARIDEGQFKARPDGTRITELQWFAPPDDRTSSFCEIWLPVEVTGANVRVDVMPPGDQNPANGGTMFEIDLAMYLTDVRVGGKIVGQYSEDLHRGHRGRIMVALAPTDPVALPGPDHAAAPAGRWTLRVVLPAGVTLGGGSIAARIQRDTSYGQGNTGAKQGVFVDPVDVPYGPRGALAEVDTEGAMLCRFGTINGMATSPRTLVVAGHVETPRPPEEGQTEATRIAARYSSAGSALVPPGRQVDCSAPVERSPVLPGVVGAGTRTGISVALRGTSSAAPQAARALAVALLADKVPTDDSYLSLLLAGNRLPGAAPDPRLGRFLLPWRPEA